MSCAVCTVQNRQEPSNCTNTKHSKKTFLSLQTNDVINTDWLLRLETHHQKNEMERKLLKSCFGTSKWRNDYSSYTQRCHQSSLKIYGKIQQTDMSNHDMLISWNALTIPQINRSWYINAWAPEIKPMTSMFYLPPKSPSIAMRNTLRRRLSISDIGPSLKA